MIVRIFVVFLAIFFATPALADITGVWFCKKASFAYSLTLKGTNESFTGISFSNEVKQGITAGVADKRTTTFVRDATAQNITHKATYRNTEMTGVSMNESLNGRTVQFSCSQ